MIQGRYSATERYLNLRADNINFSGTVSGITAAMVGALASGGTAAAATKLATTRLITIGSKGYNFDGSAAISFTLAEIGAQAALGFTPYNSTNPSGYITSASSLDSSKLTGTINTARLPYASSTEKGAIRVAASGSGTSKKLTFYTS